MAERRYPIKERIFTHRHELIQHLLKDSINALSQGVQENQSASMLLSGGTTPGDFYKALSAVELPWEKIYLGMTDERWVAPDDEASNERFINSVLIQNKASVAKFVVLKSQASDVREGYLESAKNIARLPTPYDMVLLGMGLDGHVASLFPDSPDTVQALDLSNKTPCHYIHRGGQQTPRITMTLKALLNSKAIGLYFHGKDKWAVYQAAKHNPKKILPVSHVLHQDEVPVTIYWTV